MASPDHDVSGRGGYVGPHRHLEDQADHLLFFCHLSSCSETLLSRFLVASPPVQDLLLSAKYLFGAARTVCHGLQCDIGCIFSSLYPSLAVPLLSRFAPSQRLVALRQTFVHRCHLPAGGS